MENWKENQNTNKHVEAMKNRFVDKDMVAQATSLALNEIARESKLGDENVQTISREVHEALQEFNSGEHPETMDDLRLLAWDTTEGILIRLGFDQPELYAAFRDAYTHYASELAKEKAE